MPVTVTLAAKVPSDSTFYGAAEVTGGTGEPKEMAAQPPGRKIDRHRGRCLSAMACHLQAPPTLRRTPSAARSSAGQELRRDTTGRISPYSSPPERVTPAAGS